MDDDGLKWLACNKCDRVFHLKCTEIEFQNEDDVNVETLDFDCC